MLRCGAAHFMNVQPNGAAGANVPARLQPKKQLQQEHIARPQVHRVGALGQWPVGHQANGGKAVEHVLRTRCVLLGRVGSSIGAVGCGVEAQLTPRPQPDGLA